MRTLNSFVLVVVLAAFAPAELQVPQQSPPQAPTFRGGVSLLRVDAAVLDGKGTAVPSLGPDNFQVTLDGRPRKVLVARFAGATSPQEASADQSTFASNTPGSGRALVLLIDLESMFAGQEKAILDTAARLVDTLRAEDAVALVPLPGTGVDLTRDRQRVSTAIRHLTGVSPPWTGRYHFSYEEALAFERNNTFVKRDVIERECRARGGNDCPQRVEDETRERLTRERLHVEMVLSNVARLAAHMRNIPAPVTLVLMSAGLAFEPQTMARFRDVQAAVKESGVSIATVHVSLNTNDASANRGTEAIFGADPDLQSGVANLATMSGGAVYQAIGTGQGVFDRLRAELTQVYELGIEPEPGDLDGKPHELRIAVDRASTVRARRFVTAVPARDAPTSLADLIKQPLDLADLPIAVAVHSTRGDAAATLTVLVRADIAHGASQRPSGRYAAVIVSGDDEIVTSASDVIPANGAVLVAAQLTPGRYTLRFGALDDTGRAGVVQRPFTAGLRAMAGLQSSDLIVATSGQGELRPSIFAGSAGGIVPAIELTTSDPTRFDATSVSFELRRADGNEVVSASPGHLDETPYDRQRIARTTIPTAGLPDGLYVLSGQISVDGKIAGRVSRAFTLEAPPAAAAAAPPAPPVETPAPLPPAERTDLGAVMQRVARYVNEWGGKASLLVCVETYEQRTTPAPVGQPAGRHLKSEFALVETEAPSRWAEYRDVFEVDGKTVSDRRDRLVSLFRSGTPDQAQARRIANESARYNIGGVNRNFNVPTAALFFFTADGVTHFTFKQRGQGTVDGLQVSEIEFKETGKPTYIRTKDGKDVPSRGSLWVVPDTGVVVRTRMVVSGFINATTSVEIDVTYHRDERLEMWVPAVMREHYRGMVPVQASSGTRPMVGDVETLATATYAEYRRFETGARVVGK